MIDYEVALTTEDNPYDPIDEYDKWFFYDTQILKYCTDAYVARICHDSDQLSDENNAHEYERAIDEILKFNLTGKYKKVTKRISSS